MSAPTPKIGCRNTFHLFTLGSIPLFASLPYAITQCVTVPESEMSSSSSSDAKFSSHDTPGYVGFANLPNQVHRKSVKKGFEFTLMVVGESGEGTAMGSTMLIFACWF